MKRVNTRCRTVRSVLPELEVNSVEDPDEKCWQWYGMWPLILTSKITGLAPIRLEGKSVRVDGEWALYSKHLTWFLLAAVVTTLCMCTPVWRNDVPFQALVFVPYLMKGISAFLVYVNSVFRRKTIAEAVNQLIDNDAATKVLATKKVAIISIWILIGELMFLLLVDVIIVLNHLNDNSDPAIFVPPLVLEMIALQVIGLAALQYLDMVTLLVMQINALNKQLLELFDLHKLTPEIWAARLANPTEWMRNCGPSNATTTDVLLGRTLHRKLRRTFTCLDNVYGFPMLLIMMITFTESTITLYTRLTKSNWDAPSILWIIILVLGFYALLTPCQRIKDASSSTTEIIQRALLQPNITNEVRNELRAFSFQLLNREMGFTAFGFFPLDYSQMQSVLGTVTTYLVILIQFRPGVNDKDNSNSTSPTNMTSMENATQVP